MTSKCILSHGYLRIGAESEIVKVLAEKELPEVVFPRQSALDVLKLSINLIHQALAVLSFQLKQLALVVKHRVFKDRL